MTKHWLTNFNAQATRGLLAYRYVKEDLLLDAFIWDRTPQGHEFWRRQMEHGEFSAIARRALREMLREYEEGRLLCARCNIS